MGMIWIDLVYGLRGLARKWGFTAASVAALAIGIAANTSVFSITDAVLFRALPYPSPERLVRVEGGDIVFDRRSRTNALSLAQKERTDAFSRVCAYTSSLVNLFDEVTSRRIMIARTTPGFFSTLGVGAWMGRVFAVDDYDAGSRVCVLGYDLWRSQFGSDPNIVNKSVELNGQKVTIIGVMPRTFYFHSERGEAKAYYPFWAYDRLFNDEGSAIIGRLKPEVTLEQAQAQVDAIFQRLIYDRGKGEDPRRRRFRLVPLEEDWKGDLRKPLLILHGAVFCLLLICCSNVANYLIILGASKRKDAAIRAAMGCSRSRLISQPVIQAIILCIAGGLFGVGLTTLTLNAVVWMIPVYVPGVQDISLNWRVLAFSTATMLGTSMLVAIAPAWQCMRSDVNDLLKRGNWGVTATEHSGLRSLIVVVEVGLAIVLLCGTGLLVRSMQRFLSINLGFRAERVVTIDLEPIAPQKADENWYTGYYMSLLDRVRGASGVQWAAISDFLPITQRARLANLKPVYEAVQEAPEGEAEVGGQDSFGLYCRFVSSDYFRALQVPLVGGRYFTDSDGPRSPCVIILSTIAARKLYPNQDPVGQHATLSGKRPTACEIVGVVDEIRQWDISRDTAAWMYRPILQEKMDRVSLMVQTRGKPGNVTATVGAAMRDVDRRLQLDSFKTLESHVRDSYSRRTFITVLLGVFGAISLFVAAIGVHIVIAYLVEQRTHEIAVRRAMGAQDGEVMGLFLKQGLRTVSVGVLIGIGSAMALTRLLSDALFEVDAIDPATFLGVVLVLFAVTLLHAIYPQDDHAKLSQ